MSSNASKKKSQTTQETKSIEKTKEERENRKPHLARKQTENKKPWLAVSAVMLVLAFIVGIGIASMDDVYGFIMGKYEEYVYNLPENVAQREEDARLAVVLQHKKDSYLQQVRKLNNLVDEYNQATVSAGMTGAKAWQHTREITKMVNGATIIDDPIFAVVDEELLAFEATIEATALENTKNYYLRQVNESSDKLASYDEELVDQKLKSTLEEQAKEIEAAIAAAKFTGIEETIAEYSQKVTAAKPTPKPTPVPQADSQEALAEATVNNTPPGAGYSSQVVEVDGQRFTVNIVAADMGSTKVVVDTASDEDCRENCPVMSLGEYVSRSGAFAGINGSYFMPYDNTNSYDGYVKNKNGSCIHQNADGWRAIFNVGSMSFTAGSEWGCQGDDGGISNYPLLVYNGEARGEHADSKISTTKSNRSFVGNKGATAYIGIVRQSTSIEAGKVLQAMGLDNALGLDAGGSTALWANGGYKFGPGRGLPNVILFVPR